ncbi:class I SAM-dependent methyltransferase [Caenispirillum bisanense]|uniref:SAM-dependent methyltransferase n=1 Tax=Caenispirillum bisanense TaxID=414052 RepID=UPI0031E34A26
MMSAFWDDKFAGRDYVYGTEPNAFLVSQRHRLTPGMEVLAVADGEGRNGVWLAEQGMRVSTVDGSPVAVQKALKLALDRRVTIHAQVADLTDWVWPVAAFDAVAAIFIHFGPDLRRSMHHAMYGALKPGGLLLMEVFHPDQLGRGSGGPPVREMLYDAAILADDFRGADILHLDEVETDLDEGPLHRGSARVTRLVARRPQ